MASKARWILFGLILVLGISACGAAQTAQPSPAAVQNAQGSAPAAQPTSAPGVSANPAPDGAEPASSTQDRLAVGTLMLEGTDQAVSAAQAKTLLPLWQAVKTLTVQNGATTEQIQAAYQKIQDAMTAGQIQAIEAKSLSQADLQTLMTSLGIQAPAGAGNGQAGPQNPGGTPPGAQGTRPARQGTPGAPSGPGGGRGMGMNSLFIDPLISLLEKRAGAS